MIFEDVLYISSIFVVIFALVIGVSDLLERAYQHRVQGKILSELDKITLAIQEAEYYRDNYLAEISLETPLSYLLCKEGYILAGVEDAEAGVEIFLDSPVVCNFFPNSKKVVVFWEEGKVIVSSST